MRCHCAQYNMQIVTTPFFLLLLWAGKQAECVPQVLRKSNFGVSTSGRLNRPVYVSQNRLEEIVGGVPMGRGSKVSLRFQLLLLHLHPLLRVEND